VSRIRTSRPARKGKVPAGLDALDEVAELLGGSRDRSRFLLRGVMTGALAGAALAGLALRAWQDRERGRKG
jgi:hypothetical protein